MTLEFEGVYMNAMVYINNDFAGQHPYGYSNFYIKADRFLKYGEENEIKVVARTADDSRWYTGIGIYRDTKIMISNPVRSEEHTSELQSRGHLVCRLLLEKKK